WRVAIFPVRKCKKWCCILRTTPVGRARLHWKPRTTTQSRVSTRTTVREERGHEMIDHVYISVTDVEKSLPCYADGLQPLDWRTLGNYDAASGPEGVPDLHGLGDDEYVARTGVGSSIWLRRRNSGETGLYLGIVCNTNEAVDAAYAAALDAGGIDEGA